MVVVVIGMLNDKNYIVSGINSIQQNIYASI